MIFYGKISDEGTLTVRDKNQMEAEIAKLPPGRVQIIIHPVADAVSTRLRKYYWALCRLVAAYHEDIGHPNYKAEKVHEENKKEFMTRYDMNYATGKVYSQEQSHMDLTNAQMLEVCRLLQVKWAERGLYLPDPNEKLENHIKGSP